MSVPLFHISLNFDIGILWFKFLFFSHTFSASKPDVIEISHLKTEPMSLVLLDTAVEAALGEAFSGLLKAVLNAKSEVDRFNSELECLERTLNSIRPTIEEIEELQRELDRPEEDLKDLIEHLKDGEKLVRKCLKVPRWKSCMSLGYAKLRYASKLRKLDAYIVRFFHINIQAQQSRDIMQILVLNRSQSNYGLLGSCGVPQPPDPTVGLDVPIRELKEWLFEDEAPPVLVLSASGGCGKTTLAIMLCRDEKVTGKFGNNIFFVTVSKTPNLRGIIQSIIQHTGKQVPGFQSDEHAVYQLENLLRKTGREGRDPVLLVLDDVWSGSESLVDKFVFNIPKYKILVTSRSEIPRFKTYNLKLLNDEDAMTLFRQSAFQQNGSSDVPEDLVNKVVKNFKGIPLALKVVGRSLRGQPPFIWQSKVKDWSKQSIFSSENDLFECLQPSLDVLDNKLKDCFMDLGSFPEDQRIPAAALIDMWVELYELDEDDVSAMRNLHELSTRNLVNLVGTRKNVTEEDDGFYNGHFVTQHDLLRELAIYQSNKNPIEQRKRLIIDKSENPSSQMLSEQPMSARLLSISRFSTDEMLSPSWSNMQLPDVEVLILNFWTENYTLPEFMEKLNKLKVVILMNNGFCLAELSNFSLLGSLSNLKRIRLENISIPSLGNIQLNKLQKISFIMCRIGQAFRNCTTQLPDMLPNLVVINIDYCNDLVELPGSLCDIVHLKKLSITNCHKLSELPDRIGNLANLEVLRLRACTELLELPGSIGSLHKLSSLDISDCVSMKRMPEQMGQWCNLRKLDMRGCSSLSELPPSIKDLEHLERVFCDEEISTLWESFGLSNLKIHVLEEDVNLNWLPNLKV